jgi:hypothetical protein
LSACARRRWRSSPTAAAGSPSSPGPSGRAPRSGTPSRSCPPSSPGRGPSGSRRSGATCRRGSSRGSTGWTPPAEAHAQVDRPGERVLGLRGGLRGGSEEEHQGVRRRARDQRQDPQRLGHQVRRTGKVTQARTGEQKEPDEVRRRIGELESESEFLKKAAAFFARSL